MTRVASYTRFEPTVYNGVAESALTSNVYFVGDAHAVNWSLVSSSATASRWTVQGNVSDGFFSALPASGWVDVQGVTAQGFYAISQASIPRWVRWQRAPSNSSCTVALSFRVGP